MKFKGFLIVYLLSMTIVANEVRNDKLLPEVQHLLAIPDLNESDLTQNGYVDLLALDAPENTDYMAVAKKVLIKNNQLLREAINQQDVKLFKNVVTTADYYQNKSLSTNMGYGIEYEFPCTSLKKLQCVDQIIRDREQLEALIKRNATILMRYKRAQAKPYYKVYPFSAEMPIPVYHISLHASWLRLSEAIFAIDEGDVHRGLIILQEEMDFAKNKLLTNGYVIETMIATRHLLITAHVLAQLIDKPQLKPYISDPRLIALFQPLTNKQQQAMANTLKNERLFVVMNAYLATEKTIREHICIMKQIGFEDDIIVYFNQAEALGYPLKYDRLVSTNLDYQLFSQQIERALLVLPASSIKYQVEKLIKPQPLTIQAIYQKFGANNVLGGIGYEADKYSDYLYRFYDVNNYLWLLQVKLQIKQLDISQDKVVEFLSESGLKNPYSQQPIQWDSSTQILSSDWLGNVYDDRDGVRASVYIPFNE